jgi:hypothetical protein
MVRSKTVAATHIQDFRTSRNYARDFQGHVIGAANFAPSPFAQPAAFDARDENFQYQTAPSPRSPRLAGKVASPGQLTAEPQSSQRLRRGQQTALEFGRSMRHLRRHHDDNQQARCRIVL